jgi:DNA-binding NtrC family response regulator
LAFESDARGIFVRDLGSSNGTMVSARRLTSEDGAVLLTPGEIVEAGSSMFMIQEPRTGDGRAEETGVAANTIARVRAFASKIAPMDVDVLIVGARGTGKARLARSIHEGSSRAHDRLLEVECDRLTRHELDGLELFGEHTVLLRGLDRLRGALQPVLVEALEDEHARVLATAREPLGALVERGGFDARLLARFAGIQVNLRSLAESPDQISSLAGELLAEMARSKGPRVRPLLLEAEGLELLRGHAWPGNVAELREVLQRAAVRARQGRIRAEDLQFEERGPSNAEDDERQRILLALAECAGNQTKAAQVLNISRRTLVSRLDKYGIARPRKGRD